MAWLPWKRPSRTEAPAPARSRYGMGRLFDDFWREGRLPATFWGELAPLPALDVRETDDEIVAELEAPGLSADDLEISVTEDALTIRGEKKSEREEKEGDYHLTERSRGSFVRSVRLSAGVDRDKATAAYKDGVVTVTLPKTEQSKPRKIEVK